MVDEVNKDPSLNDRLLDLFIYAPMGVVLTALDDFPKLASIGRERVGAQVSTARVIGEFAVKAGQQELKRRSEGFLRRKPTESQPQAGPVGLHSVPTSATPGEQAENPIPSSTATSKTPVAPGTRPSSNGHIPTVSSLAIPGFDTLSASQVVQRLGGLSRGELVSARVYEAGTRGRRTILSKIDQLLDERA